MKKITVLYLLFAILNVSNAQLLKEEVNTRNIEINNDDTAVYFSVLIDKYNKDIKIDKMYYWYMSGSIGKNMGGYAGYLLHGEYKTFINDEMLVEKGNFRYGLKEGKWTEWYNNGIIKSLSEYKEGNLNNWMTTFNKNGQVLDSVYYDEGVITEPKKFTIKLPSFKKQKDDNNDSVQVTEHIEEPEAKEEH